MITLISTAALALIAGAANIGFVAFIADRLSPSANASPAAGECVALTENVQAPAKSAAVRVGNENRVVGAAQFAA